VTVDPTQAALSIANIRKSYGKFVAVDDVDIDVSPGSICALIGPNGAGKSTLVGIVSGNVRPDSGWVMLHGMDVTRRPIWRRAGLGLARSFQTANVFNSLSILDNVTIAAAIAVRRTAWRLAVTRRSGPEAAAARSALGRTGLAGMEHLRAADLAQGDRKRLEIALALAAGGDVLVLDEPTAGVAQQEASIIVEVLRGLSTSGMSILLVEHDFELVRELADKVVVMNEGRVVFEGTAEEVTKSKVVRDIYLEVAG
jgi:branched-chain amino acid transport system ATP-binding protein